jgi:Gnt-I system low-affinity gluconate transporter
MLPEGALRDWLGFIGHPFVALLTACGLAYALFSGKTSGETMRNAMAKSLEPAGVVILVTGAGGAFKQVLVDTGAGAALAEAASAANLTPLVAGFALAAIVRVAQGSATVAMITGAGLVAPIAIAAGLSPMQLAGVTIAIAAGASVLSHVNDSGFWLINRYLGQTESQTLRSWTVISTIVGLIGFATVCAIYPFL